MEKEQMEIDPQCVLKMTEDLVNLTLICVN